ncbi:MULTISPECIES: TetR/AcrR family transcriptional regulator [Actinomycetes]|jgi:AcrR family transcriptional regulator|uniref:Transcriptional regulator n=4 Tax=Gordonia paraffinivorans TaxID=175628 RepID=A0ABQ0IP61_9ACTN|nr:MULTISPECIES: TetR/AcrR family transcriptional regulator [Actinomycetes]MBY4572650.1 TetR family transcriptional regulator [Gordonia paraffinivorans]PWD41041.1 TetR family transcriptional regulator [Gordonia paraffinivorans]GAC85347.1 putative transcriptional regulator [Gordonia paraffinivorans NBRC 108238]
MVPRRADPERIAQKREQIAVEAGRLFAAQGYDRTSVAEVAKAVGTSPASVFYYFEDKASLFRAVFERDLPAAEALIARHVEAPDPVTAILDVLDALARDAADPSASGMLIELLRRAGDDPELLAVVGRTANVLREGLAALISRGITEGAIDPDLDATETAAWLQAIVDATYLNARPGHSPHIELHRTVLGYLNPPQGRQEEPNG